MSVLQCPDTYCKTTVTIQSKLIACPRCRRILKEIEPAYNAWAYYVGKYLVGYDGGIYLVIRHDPHPGAGFYLQAATSTCSAPWRDISERAVDRTFHQDYTLNFQKVAKETGFTIPER